MKEVTRIRIAKTSYDIDLTAKKQLEVYIQALHLYADDDNILEDIEIRITELLAERGIRANDAISDDDIKAIRTQLGEPKEFTGEGDVAIGEEIDASTMAVQRKWYRDIDHALLGGVLSGLARYMSVNPLWVRLLFVAIVFISFGFGTLVYILFWVLLPVAVTATEKLQARGEPVTLAAIRRQSESDEGVMMTQERLRIRRRVVSIGVGIIGIIGAVLGIFALLYGVFLLNVSLDVINRYAYGPFLVGVAVTGVGLYILLCSLVAYGGLRVSFTKKLVISCVVIILFGLATLGAGVALISHQAWQQQNDIQKSIEERALTLPIEFDQTKKLHVDASNVTVEYRVSSERRATLTSVPGVKVALQMTGSELRVITESDQLHPFNAAPLLVVYGPALDAIESVQGTTLYYGSADGRPAVKVTAQASRIILYGTYSSAVLTTKDQGTISAEGANVADVTANMEAGSEVSVGNIAQLTATQPTTCAADTAALLSVESVGASQITYNGVLQSFQAIETSCAVVQKSASDMLE